MIKKIVLQNDKIETRREKETAATKTKQNKLNVKMKQKRNSENEFKCHFLPVIKASEKFRCIYLLSSC